MGPWFDLSSILSPISFSQFIDLIEPGQRWPDGGRGRETVATLGSHLNRPSRQGQIHSPSQGDKTSRIECLMLGVLRELMALLLAVVQPAVTKVSSADGWNKTNSPTKTSRCSEMPQAASDHRTPIYRSGNTCENTCENN